MHEGEFNQFNHIYELESQRVGVSKCHAGMQGVYIATKQLTFACSLILIVFTDCSIRAYLVIADVVVHKCEYCMASYS